MGAYHNSILTSLSHCFDAISLRVTGARTCHIRTQQCAHSRCAKDRTTAFKIFKIKRRNRMLLIDSRDILLSTCLISDTTPPNKVHALSPTQSSQVACQVIMWRCGQCMDNGLRRTQHVKDTDKAQVATSRCDALHPSHRIYNQQGTCAMM